MHSLVPSSPRALSEAQAQLLAAAAAAYLVRRAALAGDFGCFEVPAPYRDQVADYLRALASALQSIHRPTATTLAALLPELPAEFHAALEAVFPRERS
jgi:hypothetical protein